MGGHALDVGRQDGCGSPGPGRALCALSAFSYELVVLVTVSRLCWVPVTGTLPWGSVECSRTPQMDSSGIRGQGGQALARPICHEIMPKQQSMSPSGGGLAP